MQVPTRDPFFRVITASEFERQDLADLAAGRCAAIRVPGLLPEVDRADIFAALTRATFESYGTERVDPPVMRFGVGVSDHRDGGAVTDSYWESVARSNIAWADLGLTFDPYALCRDMVGKAWPGGVSVATRRGREMGPGVAREPNQGFRVHFDDASREFDRDFLDHTLIGQFAFNLYLSVPEVGGETVVWRHRWTPGDESFRLPHSYGYDEAVVKDAESIEIKPQARDAVLLDPRYFHAVRPSRDARRIALGFAVGLTDEGSLVTWG